MEQIQSFADLFEKEKKQAIEDYFQFLRFPSISTDPAYRSQVQACAIWLRDYLENAGLSTELWPTNGHPTLFASYMKAGPDKPTLLIYHHYDVQPIDPLSEWHSPPFEPTLKGDEVYARGAEDNKGQCFYTILALRTLLKHQHLLPINIKLCIEGEEECGSVGLSKILSSKATELQADYLAIVDLGLRKRDAPAVTLGTRGLVTLDVEITGSNIDLHSGSHGGMAFNPNHAMIQLLALLRDASGKITVPHFYDDVMTISKEEKANIDMDLDENEWKNTFGYLPAGGETEFLPIERVWTRPTIEINGISGGYSGPGFKTVIPCKAHAKVSCRLVPNQEPKKIAQLVADFLKKNAPKGTEINVKINPGGGPATRANVHSKIVKAFSQAFSEVFKAPCKYIFEGGSIPIVNQLAEVSGGEVVLVGLGLPDDCVHAPNEHFGIDRIEQGFLVMARAIHILGGTT